MLHEQRSLRMPALVSQQYCGTCLQVLRRGESGGARCAVYFVGSRTGQGCAAGRHALGMQVTHALSGVSLMWQDFTPAPLHPCCRE
jgi:hypothetical protein